MKTNTGTALCLQCICNLVKGQNLTFCKGSVFLCIRVTCGQMGEDSVHSQIFHPVNRGDLLHILTADAQAVHACIHGNVHMEPPAVLLQSAGVFHIYHGLRQVITAKKRKLVGMGTAQD
ncbi:hypothetical protein IMSAG185_00538 [Lachnospiraceae bacterium]|nr:hypothetical protein IMSAG185_00538 [Lachnospiraceae bacterium]